MPTIIKIFFLLFFQHALTAKEDTPNPFEKTSGWYWNAGPVQTELSVETDSETMEQVINMCSHKTVDFVTRDLPAVMPGETKTRIVYTDLPKEVRELISMQLTSIYSNGKVRIEWQEVR